MIDETILDAALEAYREKRLTYRSRTAADGETRECMRAAAKVIEARIRAEDIEIVLALRGMPIPKTKQKTMAREFAIAIVEGIARAIGARRDGVPL